MESNYKVYIDALIEGLYSLKEMLSTTDFEESYVDNANDFDDDEFFKNFLNAQEEWIESGCMKKYNKYNF